MYNKENSWDTGDGAKEATACSHCGDKKYQYHFDPIVWGTIKALCREKPKEWQALLIGYEQGLDVFITGYYICYQHTTGSSVKNNEAITKEFIAGHKIIAGIHSHSDMGVFFSDTDDDATNMSFIRHNIVVNNKLEFKAKTRVDLPCGMVKFMDANIGIAVPEVTAEEIEGLDKIKEITYGGVSNNYLGYDPQYKPFTPWQDNSKGYELKDKPSFDVEGKDFKGYAKANECPNCHNWREESGGMLCRCFSTGLRPLIEPTEFVSDREVWHDC